MGLRTCWPTRSVVHQPGRNHSFHLFFFCCFVFLTAHRRDVSAATSVINELKQPQIDPWKRLSEAFQREKERGAIDWSAWLLSFFTEISLRNEELSHSRLWSIVYRLAPRFCFFLFLITGAAKLSRIDSSVSRTDGVMGKAEEERATSELE